MSDKTRIEWTDATWLWEGVAQRTDYGTGIEYDVAPSYALDWIIVGGESGPHARPMHPDWARTLRDQCDAASVPFHFKQWGEFRYYPDLGTETTFRASQITVVTEGMPTPQATFVRLGKRAAGRELDGRTWDEYPDGGVS